MPLGTIIYIGNFELPDRNAAALRVRGNARIFRDLGYRVVLLGAKKDIAAGSAIERADSGEAGIEGWQIPYPCGAADWFERTVSEQPLQDVLSAAGVEDLSMVVFYNHRAIAQWRMARAARKLGGKAVADITEWYANEKLDGPAAAVKNLDTWLRMHPVSRGMDGLISTSPYITQHFAAAGLPTVELPTIIPLDPATIGSPPAVRVGPCRLMFAGTGFEPSVAMRTRSGLKDRLDWVLELLGEAKRRGAQFTIDLFGVEREKYLALVPEHRGLLNALDGGLTFHGRQPHAAVLECLRRAHFSIFFRKHTRVTLAGFPSKMSESITYGTPVITNPMPSTSRFLVEGENGFLIDPLDREVAGRRLTEILATPAVTVNAMKAACAMSGSFTHKAFMPPVSDWIARVKNRA